MSGFYSLRRSCPSPTTIHRADCRTRPGNYSVLCLRFVNVKGTLSTILPSTCPVNTLPDQFTPPKSNTLYHPFRPCRQPLSMRPATMSPRKRCAAQRMRRQAPLRAGGRGRVYAHTHGRAVGVWYMRAWVCAHAYARARTRAACYKRLVYEGKARVIFVKFTYPLREVDSKRRL